MRSNYRAVIFDFDNTLINYTLCEQEALKAALLLHGIIQEEDTQWLTFREVFDPINGSYWENRHAYTREELTLYTFRDALQHFLGKTDAAEQLAVTYWDTFCNSCYFEPGAHELLHHVAKTHRIGLITNGYAESQRKRLEACGIAHLFDSVVISDEVGLRKPHPHIFEIALKELDVSSSEVLYVGDSLQDDYCGANNAGIPFCFYNRDNTPILSHNHPSFEITRLSELTTILRKGTEPYAAN